MGITYTRVRTPLALSLVSLAVHFIPFIYSANPLGYDTGFYRRYLIQPFVSFPNPQVPGLGTDALLPRLILDTLRFVHVPTDLVLYGSYIAFLALLPVLLYYWLLPHVGKRAALIGGLLLALSPIGYTAFWYMLYKNAFALCLMLLAFIAYERRAFWPHIALDIAIAVSHKTSAIIYLITLGVLMILDRSRWKEVIVHGVLTGACMAILFLNLFTSTKALGSGAVAVFIEWGDYITYSIPLIIASLGTMIHRKNIKIPRTLLALTVASFAFPVFSLPFYQRIFVFTDVALIALAAYGIDYFISKISFGQEKAWVPYGYFVVVCLIIGLHLGNLKSQMSALRPLETDSNLQQISAIGALVPDNAILLTTNNEAPWYEGWTEAHIAAPGMLRDTHNFSAWVTLWSSTSTPEQTAFLNTFPKPLYISTLGNFAELIGIPPKCVTKVAANLLRNDCR